MKEVEELRYALEKLEIYKTQLEAQNTELRNIELELREKSLENETLLYDAPIIYLLMDNKFNIIKWNKLAEKLFCFSQSKRAVLKIFSFYFLNKNLEKFLNWINKKEFLHTPINLELTIANKTETFKIYANQYAHNEKLIMISMISIQKEIDLFNDTKKKSQLLEAQSKMALLGEMLNNISHQWRQPLSTMTVAASGIKLKKEMDMLEEDTLNEFLDAILTNSKFLSKTIDDFRNFALNRYEEKEFDIKETIEKSIAIFKSKLQSKKILLHLNLYSILYYGSQSQLMQVFVNFLSNALDQFDTVYTEKKIILIKCEEKDDFINIEFSDNAGGVPASIIDKIFEPYFTTKNKNTGTGIGLHMSSSIIEEEFDGKLTCENRKIDLEENTKLGATFIISLKNKKPL